jgi:hypothetical protein
VGQRDRFLVPFFSSGFFSNGNNPNSLAGIKVIDFIHSGLGHCTCPLVPIFCYKMIDNE